MLAGRRSDRPEDDQEPDSPTSPKSAAGDGEATTSVQGRPPPRAALSRTPSVRYIPRVSSCGSRSESSPVTSCSHVTSIYVRGPDACTFGGR